MHTLYDFTRTKMREWGNTAMAVSQYTEVLDTSWGHQVSRIYTCRAEEIRGDASQLDFTYNFERAFSWIDVALHVQLKVG